MVSRGSGFRWGMHGPIPKLVDILDRRTDSDSVPRFDPERLAQHLTNLLVASGSIPLPHLHKGFGNTGTILHSCVQRVNQNPRGNDSLHTCSEFLYQLICKQIVIGTTPRGDDAFTTLPSMGYVPQSYLGPNGG